MPLSVRQFQRRLIESGVLSGREVKTFLDSLSSPPESAEDLSDQLGACGRLTEFQAEILLGEVDQPLTLGEYVILDRIGAGGMGQVFLAEHRRMRREVAVKLLPPEVADDIDAKRRFLREVQIVAKLSHPNIVIAYDAGEANGVAYFVMEYVHGTDLATLVQREGPLPVIRAVDYTLQAARGLAFAHAHGIVHRDIKPANLLQKPASAEPATQRDLIKILDMGLARFDERPGDIDQAAITGTGTVMGTVDYMSPEQAVETKTADERSDIYSLGATLYFLLIGRPMYTDATLMKRLIAHRESPIPSFETDRDDVPERIEATFRQMVAKNKDERFQSMDAVIAALEEAPGLSLEFQAGPGHRGPTRAAGQPPSRTVLLGPSTTDTAARETAQIDSAAATGVFPKIDEAPDRTVPGKGRLPRLVPFGILAGLIALVVVVAMVWSGKNNDSGPEGNKRNSDQSTSQNKNPPGLPSADGPPGEVRRFAPENHRFHSFARIPDTNRLFVADKRPFVYDLQRQAVVLECSDDNAAIRDVAVSPDGSKAVSCAEDGTVCLWDVSTGKLQRKFHGHTDKVTGVDWTPDGQQFLTSSFDFRVGLWRWDDAKPLALLGYTPETVPNITTAKQFQELGPKLKGHLRLVRDVDVAPDGSFFVTGGNDSLVLQWDLKTRRIRRIMPGHQQPVECVAISGDGLRIVSGSYDFIVNVWDATTGKLLHRLIGHETQIRCVAIDEKGRRALSGSYDGSVRLWDLTTGSEIYRYEPRAGRIICVSFFQGGRFALVTAANDNTLRMVRLPTPDG